NGVAIPGSWRASPSPGRRRPSRRLLDGLADAAVGPAAADVPRHRLVDVRVAGTRYLREEGGGGHDLAGLAVAAWPALEIQPGALNALADRGLADGLDGGDLVSGRGAQRRHAGPPRTAVQVHRAGAAQGRPATELRPVHAEQITQHP